MAKKIAGSDLGIEDCDFTASGDTAYDIVREMVEHVREKHGIDMPDAETILAGKVDDPSLKTTDKASALIVQRMVEKLNITPGENPELAQSPIPRIPPAR